MESNFVSCLPCNESLPNNLVSTRGGVLDRSDTCSTYITCNTGYVLTYNQNNVLDQFSLSCIHLCNSPRCIELMVAERNQLKEDAKILWHKATDKFYFIYAFVQPTLPDPASTFSSKLIVATYPRCYSFQAWYLPTSGHHRELMHSGTEQLRRRLQHQYTLVARIQHQDTLVSHRGQYWPPWEARRTTPHAG